MVLIDKPVATDRSNCTADAIRVTQRRQISLRGLFLCITYFAAASGLATKYGLGIFVLMNGAFLTWLSFRGYLWWMQTKPARPKTFGIGWLLFAVSFALPTFTMKGCGSAPPTTYVGWEAAFMTVRTAEDVWKETDAMLRDRSQRTLTNSGQLLADCVLFCLMNLPNLLVLISPFLLYRQQHGGGRILSAIFASATVCSWTWGITMGPDLRIGYYVWSVGITTIALARPPGWRTLAAMSAIGAVWLILGQLN